MSGAEITAEQVISKIARGLLAPLFTGHPFGREYIMRVDKSLKERLHFPRFQKGKVRKGVRLDTAFFTSFRSAQIEQKQICVAQLIDCEERHDRTGDHPQAIATRHVTPPGLKVEKSGPAILAKEKQRIDGNREVRTQIEFLR